MLWATLLFMASVVATLAAAAAPLRGARARSVAVAVPIVLVLATIVALCFEPVPLRKLAGRLLVPAGLLWLALLGASARLLAMRRRGRGAMLALFAAYSLAGTGWVGGLCVAWLEREYRRLPALEEPLDAVVLLGGGVAKSPSGAPQLDDAGDRVLVATRAVRGAGALVCTGERLTDASGRVIADTAADGCALVGELSGAPGAPIVISDLRNTREEAARLAELSRARGWRRVGIVTSAWHMRRAMALCARAGVPAVPLPADFRGGLPNRAPWGLVPSGDGFALTSLFFWELLGTLADA